SATSTWRGSKRSTPTAIIPSRCRRRSASARCRSSPRTPTRPRPGAAARRHCAPARWRCCWSPVARAAAWASTTPRGCSPSGRLLMEAPGQLFLSPNGHGGTLTALADSGLLGRLRRQGVRHIFYFQVDNPLVKVADPAFLGHHILGRADVSAKIVPKESPTDKLGNLVLVDGRCTMIEY